MHAYRDQYATLFRGGRDIVLIGISTDTPEELSSWARDDEFPFLFASDEGSEVGQLYGAFRDRGEQGLIDNRTLFVVDNEGRIAWVAAPFREVDPQAYVELGEALDRIAQRAEDEEEPAD
jgi:peroxiredoxin Q/BCP